NKTSCARLVGVHHWRRRSRCATCGFRENVSPAASAGQYGVMTETTMLAGRLTISTREFSLDRVPVPVPRRGEVLVKVGAAGVCLSDVHLIEGILTPSLLDGDVVTLGHE